MRIKKYLIVLSTFFASATLSAQPPKIDAGQKESVIDSITMLLGRNYVYKEKAVLIANHIKQKHAAGRYAGIEAAPQFAQALTRDMNSIQPDMHLRIRYDPELEKRIRTFVEKKEKDEDDFENERRQNYFFRKVEILKGNIGYITFNNFADTNASSRKTVNAVMQFVSNTDALIIDLRNNFGGRGAMAAEILGYFFDKPVLTGRSYNRVEDMWTDEWIYPKALHLSMPVYILTSERSFSSAEALAYNLKHLANGVTVGDTTRGGAHATRSFAAGSGFVAFIPFTRGENVKTGTDWEGAGVIPAVPVHEDSALLKAQQLALSKQIAATRDSVQYRRLRWLLNDLQTKLRAHHVDPAILENYRGSFEEFEFTVENGKLFCRNTHQRDKKDLLVPINDSLFKIDEMSQVEFVRDASGTITHIKLYWDDGWVDVVIKK